MGFNACNLKITGWKPMLQALELFLTADAIEFGDSSFRLRD
jgi:hypothetical protein